MSRQPDELLRPRRALKFAKLPVRRVVLPLKPVNLQRNRAKLLPANPAPWLSLAADQLQNPLFQRLVVIAAARYSPMIFTKTRLRRIPSNSP